MRSIEDDFGDGGDEGDVSDGRQKREWRVLALTAITFITYITSIILHQPNPAQYSSIFLRCAAFGSLPRLAR
jgi:hypothetical protein